MKSAVKGGAGGHNTFTHGKDIFFSIRPSCLHIFINKIFCKYDLYKAKCKQPSDWLSGISNQKLAWNWTVNILYTKGHDKYFRHFVSLGYYLQHTALDIKFTSQAYWNKVSAHFSHMGQAIHAYPGNLFCLQAPILPTKCSSCSCLELFLDIRE